MSIAYKLFRNVSEFLLNYDSEHIQKKALAYYAQLIKTRETRCMKMDVIIKGFKNKRGPDAVPLLRASGPSQSRLTTKKLYFIHRRNFNIEFMLKFVVTFV